MSTVEPKVDADEIEVEVEPELASTLNLANGDEVDATTLNIIALYDAETRRFDSIFAATTSFLPTLYSTQENEYRPIEWKNKILQSRAEQTLMAQFRAMAAIARRSRLVYPATKAGRSDA